MTVGPDVAAVFAVPVASDAEVPLAAARASPTAACFPVELPLVLDPAAAMIPRTSTTGRKATIIGLRRRRNPAASEALNFRGMPYPPNAYVSLSGREATGAGPDFGTFTENPDAKTLQTMRPWFASLIDESIRAALGRSRKAKYPLAARASRHRVPPEPTSPVAAVRLAPGSRRRCELAR